MEINRALNVVYSSYGHFANLPEHMSEQINKKDLQAYLQREKRVDDKAIESFLNLIFDENEENRETIQRSNFNSKYASLLKIIEEEEEPNCDVVNDKDRENNIQNTPQKEAPIVELGSPILLKTSNYKINNDLSIEAIELFKDIKFKEEKMRTKKLNYDSIVRPSNNFNFSSNANSNGANELLIHDSNAPKHSPRNDSKDKEQFNTKVMLKSKGLTHLNNPQRMLLGSTPSKANSIQQKLQDVYYQIYRPNSEYSSHQYNISPIKLHQQHHSNYVPMTGVMSSNNPILKEDYFTKIYREVNSASSTKSINRKVSQLIDKEKRNELHQHYAWSSKIPLNRKFEGLSKMLYCKSNGLNEEKLLNQDDFVTLEDKISQFALLKKSSAAKMKDSYHKPSHFNDDRDNEEGLNVPKLNLDKVTAVNKGSSERKLDNENNDEVIAKELLV